MLKQQYSLGSPLDFRHSDGLGGDGNESKALLSLSVASQEVMQGAILAVIGDGYLTAETFCIVVQSHKDRNTKDPIAHCWHGAESVYLT